MTSKFSVRVENGPDVTGSVLPEVTRFDVYISGVHDSHADSEHTGLWGQIELPAPLPFMEDYFDGSLDGLAKLRHFSTSAYWYATGLLDAATLMDDFEADMTCDACRAIV